MLWYKAWLETRWRFLIGLAVLMLSASGTVLAYPEVKKLLPLAPRLEVSGELARRITEAMELSREYRGYVWAQWFVQNMPQQWTLFAALLGSGGLLSQAAKGGGALFTLSLPVSRDRLVAVRATTGLSELLVIAIVPSLVLPALSPAVGQSYAIGDALVHAVCIFVAGAIFFSLALLLSTVFSDIWSPALLVLGAAILLAACEQLFPQLAPYGLFRVMSAEAYFRGGGLPWAGLAASAAASAGLLYGAVVNTRRQDF